MNQRYDFVYLFDVKDGNPNGDPDAGNLPRVDAETGHGLITDVCLKRKIRNYVQLLHNSEQGRDVAESGLGYDVYVREKAVLNQQHERAFKALNIPLDGKEVKGRGEVESSADAPDSSQSRTKEKKRKGGGEHTEKARQWMCRNFYDVRTFGAVMSTGVNCGQVRGPVQFTFGRSSDPVIAAEHSITRMAVTTVEEAAKQDGDNRTMGRKFTIPYGLYRTHGFVSAPLAAQTGFSEADLNLLWEALGNMFEHDRSASRGEMAARSLLLFRHASAMGEAPAHALFDRVQVALREPGKLARTFADYTVTFDGQQLDQVLAVGGEKEIAKGVTLVRRV
ncbi:MAG: type I-C CRISPR-associated protein Cas7/Csd2 [Magnetococcales bacterium]|nr:type I-C CRISPR-associated protein Cas7/Csd2 [Magnetococcales bacterium]